MEPTPEQLAARVRPLVNGILDTFNREQVTLREAGWVILALTHKLLTMLDQEPEERQTFILQFINVVNQYLAGNFEQD
jgi:hypothetical protein|uniref:Uncharacterized protein n=1 Tax=Desulfobacca acetoxidans TaxID=60893 RepID=A0A7V4LDJ0_9BACT